MDVKFTELPVAIMSISSPAAAPEARMSIPPEVEVITTESAALSPAEIFTEPEAELKVKSILAPVTLKFEAAAPSREMAPVESIVVPPVPESQSIPPAALLASMTIALTAASPPSIFTDPEAELRVKSILAPVTEKFEASEESKLIAPAAASTINHCFSMENHRSVFRDRSRLIWARSTLPPRYG